MPQTPLNLNTRNPAGALVAAQQDAAGNQLSTVGGAKSALNQTAAAVIKATPGRIAKVTIIAPGSGSGTFTLNDCATTGAAAAANAVFVLAYNATANVAGAVFDLDWPCAVGIVLSAVPGAGSPIVAISYS